MFMPGDITVISEKQVYPGLSASQKLDLNFTNRRGVVRPYLDADGTQGYYQYTLFGSTHAIPPAWQPGLSPLGDIVSRIIIPLGTLMAREQPPAVQDAILQVVYYCQRMPGSVDMVRVCNFPQYSLPGSMMRLDASKGIWMAANPFCDSPHLMEPLVKYVVKPILVVATHLESHRGCLISVIPKPLGSGHCVLLTYLVKLGVNYTQDGVEKQKQIAVQMMVGEVSGGSGNQWKEKATARALAVVPSIALGGVCGLSLHVTFSCAGDTKHLLFLRRGHHQVTCALLSSPLMAHLVILRPITILSAHARIISPDLVWRPAGARLIASISDILAE